jgi:hypothetical protein
MLIQIFSADSSCLFIPAVYRFIRSTRGDLIHYTDYLVGRYSDIFVLFTIRTDASFVQLSADILRISLHPRGTTFVLFYVVIRKEHDNEND